VTVGSGAARGERCVRTSEEDGTRFSRAAAAAMAPVRLARDVLGLDVGTQVAPLMAVTRPPALLTRGITVKRSTFADMPVWVLSGDPRRYAQRTVVALHGGAYVVEPTILHWFDYGLIARKTGATVIVPIYPLAPRGTAADVVPAIADLLTAQIAGHEPGAVRVYGDSAGGGLALAAVQELLRRGCEVPARMVLLSPWLDIGLRNPAIAEVSDPLLAQESLARCGTLWAGDLDPRDPMVSPLYGPLAGLPPTFVYSGSRDILHPDILALRDRAKQTGSCDMAFELRTGLIHDWALPTLPDGWAVRRQIYEELLG
jgi:triacylglycerol lipase